jgi:predicted GNAT family N-acyltransferase
MKFDFDYLMKNFEVRELKSEADILDHLALRQQVFHEAYACQDIDSQYDLLPSDWNSNLIGLFYDQKQIGTIRVVKRQRNLDIIPHLDHITSKEKLNIKPVISHLLPTEYAFEITSPGNHKHEMVELSRVAVLKEFRGLGLYKFLLLSAIGVTMLDNYNYCLYSCSDDAVEFHRELLPGSDHFQAKQYNTGYPGFVFPKSSTAIVCDIQDISCKQMRQAILAGVTCRYGSGTLNQVPYIEFSNTHAELAVAQ